MPRDGRTPIRLHPDAIEGFGGSGDTLAFFGATPVARPSAYTQTFSTADKTHAARTSTAITDNGGGGAADGTIAAITGDQTVKDALTELATAINAVRADLADTAALVNSIVDDLQALGLVG